MVAACSYPGYVDGVLGEDDYWSGPLHESVVNYGFTKKSQVVQGWCYDRQYDFKSIHLLMTNLFGPREHFHPVRSHGLAALLRKFYDARQSGAAPVCQTIFDALCKEWAEKAVGSAADQHEHIEQREAHRDPPGANTGYARRIGQRADQVDGEGERANDEELGVHRRSFRLTPIAELSLSRTRMIVGAQGGYDLGDSTQHHVGVAGRLRPRACGSIRASRHPARRESTGTSGR